MILYDWKCKKEHKFEELASSDTKELPCPECGAKAIRQVSAPSIELEGITGDFPGAAAKWEKLHTPKSRGGKMPPEVS